jgi:hypothetical protein
MEEGIAAKGEGGYTAPESACQTLEKLTDNVP